MDTQSPCPCGTGLEYSHCCNPFHSYEKNAPTAEALMRSRFTAYVLQKNDYILSTWDGPVEADKIDFSKENLTWQRLEVISTKKGGIKDTKGIVEFKAFYEKNGEAHVLHEMSRFIKTKGRWLYSSGIVKSVGQFIPTSNQGKNAPCSCGSGKKFKRCCGDK